jgi:polysaccharide chain length determinant protein (PEP-CTERM system associated)
MPHQSFNVRAMALQYLTSMWRRRWTAILTCWVISIAGWGAVMMMPRQFDSQGRFYVDVDSMLTPMLRGIAIDVNPLQHLEYLRNTLLSRPNLEQVIHLADLEHTINTPAEKEALIGALASDVSIRAQTANLYVISYRNRNPIVAKNVVQSLLTLFAERSTDNQRVEMDKAQKFLNEEIAGYESQLRAAEKRRAEFHQQNMFLLPGAGTTVPRLEAMRETIHQAEQDYQDAVVKRDGLKSQLAAVPQFVSIDANAPIFINGRNLTPTEARLDEAQRNLDALRLRYTEQHPDVLAARRQIAEMEAEVQKEKERATANPTDATKNLTRKNQITNTVYEQLKVRLVDAEGMVATTKRRLDDLRMQKTELDKSAHLAPEVEAKAQDLDRDYGIIKRNYEELLQRREAAILAQAADTRADQITFRIVDPPQVPITPSTPNRPLLFSAVLLIGLGAGGGLALLLTQIDRSFGSGSQLRELGLPVLGVVAYVRSPSPRPAYLAQAAAFAVISISLLAVYGALIIFSTGLYRVVV